jgi:hypothetical protein
MNMYFVGAIIAFAVVICAAVVLVILQKKAQ